MTRRDNSPEGCLNPAFWRNKRVLVTGHTGFKGSWLTMWLAKIGAKVSGVALPPEASPNLFDSAQVRSCMGASYFEDVRDKAALAAVVHATQPDILLHLAAQPLVWRSYAQPSETFATNVMGTVHLLEALRNEGCARSAVMVTTDKVYANREWLWPYRENDSLGGHDPYSASKAASEMVIESYCKSFLTAKDVHVASARAGNVIGGGDWAEDRLLPDAIRAWRAKRVLNVRRPDAVRPWQHVLEPLHGYLLLAQALWRRKVPVGAYNFGPDAHKAASVKRVVTLAQRAWGHDAEVMWGEGDSGPHEANILSLDTSRVRTQLGVNQRWELEESLLRTVAWYRAFMAGGDARALCHADIEAYEAGK